MDLKGPKSAAEDTPLASSHFPTKQSTQKVSATPLLKEPLDGEGGEEEEWLCFFHLLPFSLLFLLFCTKRLLLAARQKGEKKRKRRGRKIFVPDPIFGFSLFSPSPPSFAAAHKGNISSSPSRGKRERKECNVVCITSLPLLLTCYFFREKLFFLFCRGKSVGKKVWKSLLLLGRRPCLNNPPTAKLAGPLYLHSPLASPSFPAPFY